MDGPDELDELEDLDDFDDIDIGVLLSEPGNESEALARWSERLTPYVQGQGSLDALRLRPDSEAPWPHGDNPMLGYLRERAVEISEHEDIRGAIEWLASHVWFEATIAERARMSRLLVDNE